MVYVDGFMDLMHEHALLEVHIERLHQRACSPLTLLRIAQCCNPLLCALLSTRLFLQQPTNFDFQN